MDYNTKDQIIALINLYFFLIRKTKRMLSEEVTIKLKFKR